MHVRVKQLCERGRRRPDREIAADPGRVGELTFALVAGCYQLNLNDPVSSVHAPLYPILRDARLTTLHGEKMLFKGEQRAEGDIGPVYVQEWAVQLEPRGAAAAGWPTGAA